jgi:hypothetical protein
MWSRTTSDPSSDLSVGVYYIYLCCIYCMDHGQCRVFVHSQQCLCSCSARVSIEATETLVFHSHHTIYSLIFLYSPAYNLAFTALVYSKHYAIIAPFFDATDWDVNSLLGRTFPLLCPSQGHRHLPVVVPWWGILQSVRESYWDRRRRYVHLLHSSDS